MAWIPAFGNAGDGRSGCIFWDTRSGEAKPHRTPNRVRALFIFDATDRRFGPATPRRSVVGPLVVLRGRGHREAIGVAAPRVTPVRSRRMWSCPPSVEPSAPRRHRGGASFEALMGTMINPKIDRAGHLSTATSAGVWPTASSPVGPHSPSGTGWPRRR